MRSSNLCALLVRCLEASSNIGRVGLASDVLAAAQARGLPMTLDAPRTRLDHFTCISSGRPCASKQTLCSPPPQQQQQQQQRWKQLTLCTRPQLPQLLSPTSMRLPAVSTTATAGSMQQHQQHQQHALLSRLLHTSAAAYKRVNLPEDEEDIPEDEMEVLLDEDEDLDLDEAGLEDEQLDDPEWVGDGGLATTRHVTGGASRYSDRSNSDDDEDDETGEYDVEFDEAWEDEEEVDDLRDQEDTGSKSQHRSLRSDLVESLRPS